MPGKRAVAHHGFATGRFAPDSWQVLDWSPAKGLPPTEVHLVLTYGHDTVIVRLRERRVVDRLVAALVDHGGRVWPRGDGHADQ